MAFSAAPETYAQSLLHLAHPENVDEATRIYKEKVYHRPIDFRRKSPASTVPKDARAKRRDLREKKKLLKNKSKPSSKPHALSAREKRAMQIYDIPKESQKYSIYEPLNRLWVGYAHEILKGSFGASGSAGQAAAAKLCAADFHGSRLEVVRNRCPSRVGISGIVVKDTKMTFVIITEKDEIKHIPKEHSVFRFEIPWPESITNLANPIVMEIHGSNFIFRAAERMTRKFKAKAMDDL